MTKNRVIISISVALALLIVAGSVIFGMNRTGNNPERLISLGEKYLLEQNYEQALIQFLKVIEIDPMNPRGYTGAAEAYIGLGQKDKAIEILERGLLVLPDNEEMRQMLEELLDANRAVQSEDGALQPEDESSGLLSAEQLAFLEPLEAAILALDYETAFAIQTSPEFLEICRIIPGWEEDIPVGVSLYSEEVVYKVDGENEWHIKNNAIGSNGVGIGPEIGVWQNGRENGTHIRSFISIGNIPRDVLMTYAKYSGGRANGVYKRFFYNELSEYAMESGTALNGLKHGEEIIETNILAATPYSPITSALGDDTFWLSIYANGKYVIFTGSEEMYYLQEQPFEDGSVGYPVCVDLETRGQMGAGYLNERNLDFVCEIW